jgi:hypothetical protein
MTKRPKPNGCGIAGNDDAKHSCQNEDYAVSVARDFAQRLGGHLTKATTTIADTAIRQNAAKTNCRSI